MLDNTDGCLQFSRWREGEEPGGTGTHTSLSLNSKLVTSQSKTCQQEMMIINPSPCVLQGLNLSHLRTTIFSYSVHENTRNLPRTQTSMPSVRQPVLQVWLTGSKTFMRDPRRKSSINFALGWAHVLKSIAFQTVFPATINFLSPLRL